MDAEKIKDLRSKISIPLDVAIQLLKKNNGNVFNSELEFHNNTIVEISEITACDLELAREYYNLYNHDRIKVIEKLNSKQTIITTKENLVPRNEIGFVLWPENKKGENYRTAKRNDAFIPSADFEYVINEFKSVFPLENSWDKTVEEYFDICGNNYFDKETCKIIINKIRHTKTDELKVAKFKNELIDWLNDKLLYADCIVVYGNL
ncbi:hypothetical protein [Flavobacterium sp.]|uniref:hypothetical protein n=1 Tax=Flavobacterium sp. TaxID=239 RepID=UPI004048BAB1